MKCPHCNKKISLFSKALNKSGNPKTCPECLGSVKVKVDGKLALLWFVPMFLLHFFILKPIILAMGYSGGGAIGIVAGLLVVLSMNLTSADKTESNKNLKSDS